jgi:hypothetical protein
MREQITAICSDKNLGSLKPVMLLCPNSTLNLHLLRYVFGLSCMYRQQVNSLQSHIQELDANLKMEPEAAESASKLHANGTEAEIRASELEAKLQEGEALISELKTLAACLEAKVKELENEKTGGMLDEDQSTGDAKEKVDAMELQADGTERAMLQSMLKTAEEKCEEFETQVCSHLCIKQREGFKLVDIL